MHVYNFYTYRIQVTETKLQELGFHLTRRATFSSNFIAWQITSVTLLISVCFPIIMELNVGTVAHVLAAKQNRQLKNAEGEGLCEGLSRS